MKRAGVLFRWCTRSSLFFALVFSLSAHGSSLLPCNGKQGLPALAPHHEVDLEVQRQRLADAIETEEKHLAKLLNRKELIEGHFLNGGLFGYPNVLLPAAAMLNLIRRKESAYFSVKKYEFLNFGKFETRDQLLGNDNWKEWLFRDALAEVAAIFDPLLASEGKSVAERATQMKIAEDLVKSLLKTLINRGGEQRLLAWVTPENIRSLSNAYAAYRAAKFSASEFLEYFVSDGNLGFKSHLGSFLSLSVGALSLGYRTPNPQPPPSTRGKYAIWRDYDPSRADIEKRERKDVASLEEEIRQSRARLAKLSGTPITNNRELPRYEPPQAVKGVLPNIAPYVRPVTDDVAFHHAVVTMASAVAKHGGAVRGDVFFQELNEAASKLDRELYRGKVTRETALMQIAPPLEAAAALGERYSEDLRHMESNAEQIQIAAEEKLRELTSYSEQALKYAHNAASDLAELSLRIDEMSSIAKAAKNLKQTIEVLQGGLRESRRYLVELRQLLVLTDPQKPHAIDNAALRAALRKIPGSR